MFGGVSRNSLGKPAQFSFAADLFMLQTILWQEEKRDHSWPLVYVFPRSCFVQVIDWLLNNASQIGLEPFEGVTIERDSTKVCVIFPDEDEQDKLHQFFQTFNQKRKQAQGADPSFPPLPDIYQGSDKPVIHVIKRYIVQITQAFDGDSDTVEIPIGPGGAEFTFTCG